MQPETYPDKELAYQKFSSHLHKYIPIIISRKKHNDLHRLIETQSEFDFYVIFKKDFFKTFNNQFLAFISNNPEMKGVAESINLSVLEWIIKREKETLLVYIYQNTDVNKKAKKYWVYPKVYHKYAINNNLIRKQNAINTKKVFNGKKEYINEVTIHLPFKKCFFKNFDDWLEAGLFKV